MKKTIGFIVLNLVMYSPGYAQSDNTSSYQTIDLKQQLEKVSNDTSRALIWAGLSYEYAYSDFDSSLLYAEKALKLSEEIDWSQYVSSSYGL